MGGVPLALEEHITRDMRILEHYRIKPIIVFSGLPPAKKDSTGRPILNNATEDAKAQKRQLGWEHYEKSRNDQAVQAFGQVHLNLEDVLRVVHRSFMHRKTEFVVAPYLAWAQVSRGGGIDIHAYCECCVVVVVRKMHDGTMFKFDPSSPHLPSCTRSSSTLNAHRSHISIPHGRQANSSSLMVSTSSSPTSTSKQEHFNSFPNEKSSKS